MPKERLKYLIEVWGSVQSRRLFPTDLTLTKLGSVDPENFEIYIIENLADIDWRKPIVTYLDNPDRSKDRKVKYRYLNYVVIGNELFKKTPEGVLLKCPSEGEAYFFLNCNSLCRRRFLNRSKEVSNHLVC